jgi:HPt (histidine-containing phosphotransfer) domain-containing protein
MHEAHEELPVIDERVLREWRDDLDEEEVAGVLARVPAEAHTCIANIKKAIAEGNLNSAKRAAHRLKGMAANLGGIRLAHVARQIELASQHVGAAASHVAALEAALVETLAAIQGETRRPAMAGADRSKSA